MSKRPACTRRCRCPDTWREDSNVPGRLAAAWAPLILESDTQTALLHGVMITSRLTSKAQTTVPQAIREALGLRPGDRLAYSIEQGRVILAKSAAPPGEDPFAAFGEWESAADVDGYGSL